MITHKTSILIHRPIEETFAYIADLRNSMQWQSGLLEVRRTTEGPLGIGTQYTSARKFLGRRMDTDIQFVAYEPDRKITFKSISGAPTFEQSFLFESTNEGTRLTSLFEMQPAGFMGLAEPLIAASIRRELDANIGTLKDLLDSRTVAVES